jgi:hypothetical protein
VVGATVVVVAFAASEPEPVWTAFRPLLTVQAATSVTRMPATAHPADVGTPDVPDDALRPTRWLP